MTRLPHFLAYLEVGSDADERAVRRAYARKLKQIDAEQDPAEFQALREAYEAALRWVQAQALAPAADLASPAGELGDVDAQSAGPGATDHAEVAEPPGQGSPEDAVPAAPVYQPGAEANEVFEEFVAKLGPRYRDLDQLKADLEHALADPRLINIEARDFFEWRLVCWLAGGWQAGNEALIGVATTRFNWDKDRQHLYRFGRPGEIVDYAIHELTVFKLQDPAQRNQQLEAIRKLREDKRPRRGDLIKYMPLVEQLAVRFPVLLPLITNAGNVQRWREWDRAIPAWRRWIVYRRSGQTAVNVPQPKGGNHRWYVGILIFLLIKAFSGFGNSVSAPAPAYAPPAPQGSSIAQQAGTRLTPNPPDPRSVATLQSVWATQIRAKIRSHVSIPKDTPLDAKAVFSVEQLPSGDVIRVALTQSSGFPSYDKAMERAIYKASPLPKAPNPQVFMKHLVLKFTPQDDGRR